MRKTLEDGYLMSQYDIAASLGIVQQTVSKAEASMLKKLKAGLSKHDITEQEFWLFVRYYMR